MRLVSKSLSVQSLTEETAGADFLATKHTSLYLCQFTSHLQTTQQDLTSIRTSAEPQPNLFPMSPCTYLWPLLFYKLLVSTSSRQSAQFCSSCLFSLIFLNCAANPASCHLGLSIGYILSTVFLSIISYSSLQPTPSFQYLVSPIPLASKIFIHTSLFFFESISPPTASHATVLIAPTAIFSHSTLYSL